MGGLERYRAWSALIVGLLGILGACSRDSSPARLEPQRFLTLPPEVLADLERRGCTIPQTWHPGPASNVIAGSFRTAGIVDRAILCSRDGGSAILVYWAGSSEPIQLEAASPDQGYLYEIDNGRLGFGRLITTAAQETILHNRQVYRASSEPPVDHEGIEETFGEHGSRIHYWYQDRWFQLPGAD